MFFKRYKLHQVSWRWKQRLWHLGSAKWALHPRPTRSPRAAAAPTKSLPPRCSGRKSPGDLDRFNRLRRTALFSSWCSWPFWVLLRSVIWMLGSLLSLSYSWVLHSVWYGSYRNLPESHGCCRLRPNAQPHSAWNVATKPGWLDVIGCHCKSEVCNQTDWLPETTWNYWGAWPKIKAPRKRPGHCFCSA